MDMLARDMTMLVSRSEAFLSADLCSALHCTWNHMTRAVQRLHHLQPEAVAQVEDCLLLGQTFPQRAG